MKGIVNPVLVAVFASLLVVSNAGEASAPEQVIKITAKKFEFIPNQITLKKGVPVVLELTSEDRAHGFNAPELNARTAILPGKATTLRLVPEKAGSFDFFCDIFCGSGHEGMNGKINVTE
jgi:cytochrome c oxidase subunit 2